MQCLACKVYHTGDDATATSHTTQDHLAPRQTNFSICRLTPLLYDALSLDRKQQTSSNNLVHSPTPNCCEPVCKSFMHELHTSAAASPIQTFHAQKIALAELRFLMHQPQCLQCCKDMLTCRMGRTCDRPGIVAMSCCRSMPFFNMRKYMTPKLAYCAAEVASPAPATPHPNTNMRKQSSPRLTKLEATAAIRGVLQNQLGRFSSQGR